MFKQKGYIQLFRAVWTVQPTAVRHEAHALYRYRYTAPGTGTGTGTDSGPDPPVSMHIGLWSNTLYAAPRPMPQRRVTVAPYGIIRDISSLVDATLACQDCDGEPHVKENGCRSHSCSPVRIGHPRVRLMNLVAERVRVRARA